MENFSLNDFPNEILENIFSKLTVFNRLKMCLVCKKWCNIINNKHLLKDVVVIMTPSNEHLIQIDVENETVYLNMMRNFFNFSFKSVLIDNLHYDLLKLVSSKVEYISFEGCVVRNLKNPIYFSDLYFENLRVLKVIDCDFWISFPNLPNLTELYLCGNSLLTDDGLAILQKSMKKLKILSLYCLVNFDPQSYKRFYPQNLSYEKDPSPYSLTLPALKSFISERANTLKELNLNPNVNAHALEVISSIKNLCLQKISLENSQTCINGLITLFKNQPNLKSVNLNGMMRLNSEIVLALCNLLPNIEEVYINNSSLTHENYVYVFQLKKLKKLDISNNYATELGFSKAVENFEAIHLQYLNVSGIKVTNIDLLIHKCKNLVELNLSQCKVSDELLHFISENLIKLQSLSLKKTDVSDYGLTGGAEIKLIENKTQHINENNHKLLSNLKNLKKLELNYCEKISDHGIAFAIRFQHLEFLDLTGCHIVRRNTIETLLQENPNLQKFSKTCLQQIPVYQ